jgi:hypothetical protein
VTVAVLGRLGFVETGRDMRPCRALGCALEAVTLALAPPG